MMKRKIYSPREKVKIEISTISNDEFGGITKSWNIWKEALCSMQQVFSRSKRYMDFILTFGGFADFPNNFRIIDKKGNKLYPIAMPIKEDLNTIKCKVRKNDYEQL